MRVSDPNYRFLKVLADLYGDTPDAVLTRLINDFSRRNNMTISMAPAAAATQGAGYLLLAQRDWLQFHVAHSVGQSAFYCRGAGGAMRNVAVGDNVFCAQTGEVPHRIHLRGTFGGWQTMTPDDAWRAYGQRLGAPDPASWRRLIARIPSLAHAGRVGLIRLDDVVVPAHPTDLDPLGVTLLRGSVKGRRLVPNEVAAILAAEA